MGLTVTFADGEGGLQLGAVYHYKTEKYYNLNVSL